MRYAVATTTLLLAACSGGAPSPAPPSEGPAKAPPAAEGAADPRPVAAAVPAGAGWDVVVITLDTTRADHLPFYGYFRDTAPRLGALAGESVVFERLVVPMATTLPTHTSLFTGVYPLEHGITANIQHGGLQFVPTDKLTSFAAHLAAHGYQTGGFTSAAPLNARTGIERGFQAFTHPKGELREGAATVDDALAWLASARADAPVLLWVHLFEPHNPYNPDPRYRKQFADEPALDAWMEARKVSKLTRRPTGDPVRAKPTWNAYDAEIRTMDDQVARVLDAIAARGRADATVTLVMGDHGEGLNQHDEPGHGRVWDEQLHAPLLLHAPGLAATRVPSTVSAVDVLPTVLGVAELPAEEALRPQLSGRDALAPDAGEGEALSLTSDRQRQLGRAVETALTTGTFKCVLSAEGVVKAWDLAADPHELGAGDADPVRAAACADRIRALVAAQEARGQALGAGKTRQMDPATAAQLEQLGYVQHED